jgi:hypothetical protein
MKRTSIPAIALALVLGATTVIYACGNSGKAQQTSTTSGSSCGSAVKASQVSATDKSQDVKAIATNTTSKDCGEMSASCGSSCLGKAKSASACPTMKDDSSTKQTKSTKIDDSSKQKSAKFKTAEIKQSNAPLASNQD